jgi:mannose-6-phosphate isomerase-like protein (cupin superfamily)
VKFQFVERLARRIEKEDILEHTSSQGCPVNIYIRSSYMTAGITTIPPGKRLGRMAAHAGDEVYYILSGECVVECARHKSETRLRKGDVFHIPAGQIHAPRNDSVDDVVIFWVCAPEWP